MADTKKGLVAKLAEVMGEMAHVPKEGFNAAQKYKFVRETDVAERASALLAERKVWIHQTVADHTITELYRTASGNTMWLSTVAMDFQFIDGETGETTSPQRFVGAGADTGDKGIYKAMTGAEKYFLMKTFLVSTGDDPEADEKVDKTVAAAGAARGPVTVTQGKQAGVQRGGKSSEATEAQVKEIARLSGSLGLDAETVVPIIRASIGKEPEDGTTIRDFLSGLSSADASKLIASLMDFKPADEKAEQESFSIA